MAGGGGQGSKRAGEFECLDAIEKKETEERALEALT